MVSLAENQTERLIVMTNDIRITRRDKIHGVIKDLRQRFFGVNGHLWLRAVMQLTQKGLPSPFPILRSVTIGTCKSVDDLREKLASSGRQVDNTGTGILGRPGFVLAEEEVEFDLFTATVGELGLEDSATTEQIFDRINELLYDLCPAEIAPQFARAYQDQPSGEQFEIAMKPIADSHGYLRVFDVGCYKGERWLLTRHAHPDCHHYVDNRWIFCRRRK